MKKEEFFNIMNDIDDDLLAREDRASANVKKLLARKLTVLVAAVLLIALCLSVVVPMVVEKQRFIELTPEMVGDMFKPEEGYDSLGFTNNYNVVRTSEVKSGTDLPDCESLPIYEPGSVRVNKKDFFKFVNRYKALLGKTIGLNFNQKIKMNQIDEEDGCYRFYEQRGESMSISCVKKGNTMKINYYNSNGYYLPNSKKINIDGIRVSVDVSDSENEIKAQLSDAISYICETFGKDYKNIKIEKSYDTVVGREEYVYVYLYNKENTDLPTAFSDISTASEYIELKFVQSHYDRYGTVPDDRAYLRGITYCESVVDYDEYYRQRGEYDMLTLGEAEEMLEKGYVFGFHACPLCAREQTGVDFTNYDYVTIVYRTGNNGIIIPFYAFYENIDKMSYRPNGMHDYAVTYVLALDIDGINEYFEKQAQYHNPSQDAEETMLFYSLRKSETEENCYYGYDTDGDVCRIYYEGNDVIDGQDYYVFINLFRNLDYPDGAPGEEDPLYEVNAVGVHLMEENE